MVNQNDTVNAGQSDQKGLLEQAVLRVHLAAAPLLQLDLPVTESRTNTDTSDQNLDNPFADSSYESIFSRGLHTYEHIWRALADR